MTILCNCNPTDVLPPANDGQYIEWSDSAGAWVPVSPPFAPLTHDHDTAYSSITHNHDGTYAPASHNHDSLYLNYLVGEPGDFIMWTETAPEGWKAVKQRDTYIIQQLEGDVANLTIRMDGVEARMLTAEGNISTLQGNIATQTIRVDGMESRMLAVENNIANLEGELQNALARLTALENA
jgi:hypothetical protein